MLLGIIIMMRRMAAAMRRPVVVAIALGDKGRPARAWADIVNQATLMRA